MYDSDPRARWAWRELNLNLSFLNRREIYIASLKHQELWRFPYFYAAEFQYRNHSHRCRHACQHTFARIYIKRFEHAPANARINRDHSALICSPSARCGFYRSKLITARFKPTQARSHPQLSHRPYLSARQRRVFHEVAANAVRNGVGEFVLVSGIAQLAFFIRVGNECSLNQNRWNIGCF